MNDLGELRGEAALLSKLLNLKPHPEGGYFVEVYKSSDQVRLYNNNRYDHETRQAGSSIYYLLNQNNFSAWHRLKSDEVWHFYRGSSVNIYIIDGDGNLSIHLLGDLLTTDGASHQVCIRAGNYFAAENVDKETYSLVGCTVSPGFEYKDFELVEGDRLLKAFPQHQDIIKKFSNN